MSRAIKSEKKDFWDMSWNPVWGCINNCPYCYAQRIAKRYAEQIARKEMIYKYGKGWEYRKDANLLEHGYLCLIDELKSFKPTWLESNYIRKFPQKPSIIFVNSMSDPAYWEPEWYEKIVARIAKNMQHTFVVLTKQPKVYQKYRFPLNTIIGCSVTKYDDFCINLDREMLYFFRDCANTTLLSIEPIQETFSKRYIELLGNIFKWIHIGQESGNRKGRIIATPEMIEPFFNLDTRVFMKKNLEGVVPGRKLRRERIESDY